MLNLERGGFSKEQVILALHGPHRKLDFRYELLDKQDRKKKDLLNITSGEVSLSSMASIKRTARFTMREDPEIEFLSDKIKPIARLFVPPGKALSRNTFFYSQQFASLIDKVSDIENSGWIEFPLGLFLLSSPSRKDEGEQVYRDVEAFDGLVVLLDDKFDARYVIQEGTSYYQAIIAILSGAGITKVNIENTGAVLPRALEFEAGKEKLYAINELLRQMNFTQLHVDVEGFYTSVPYRSPSVRGADYTYKDDEMSVTYSGMQEENDLFNIPNKWVVVRTNAEEQPMVAAYVNNNPNSPLSTVNRGRTILDYREIDNIASQESLDAYAERIAFEASQIYGKLVFETAIMPMHDFSDVLQIEYSALGIRDKYSETAWSFPLVAGGKMKHECRKVVQI